MGGFAPYSVGRISPRFFPGGVPGVKARREICRCGLGFAPRNDDPEKAMAAFEKFLEITGKNYARLAKIGPGRFFYPLAEQISALSPRVFPAEVGKNGKNRRL